MTDVSPIIANFDKNKDGILDFNEFAAWFHNKDSVSNNAKCNWFEEQEQGENKNLLKCSTGQPCLDNGVYDNKICPENESCAMIVTVNPTTSRNEDFGSCILSKYCKLARNFADHTYGSAKILNKTWCKKVKKSKSPELQSRLRLRLLDGFILMEQKSNGLKILKSKSECTQRGKNLG